MRLKLLLLLLPFCNAAAAQDWPAKPVRLILPFAAGGAVDVVTRITMNRVSEPRQMATPSWSDRPAPSPSTLISTPRCPMTR